MCSSDLYLDQPTFALYHTPDFQERALARSMSPDDVDAGEYAALYYTGGHGVMWDFPSSEGLARLCLEVYGNGGYLASVCHGIAGLLFVQDRGKMCIRDRSGAKRRFSRRGRLARVPDPSDAV